MISASLGPLAQVVEQEAFNLCVISSNLIRPTSYIKIHQESNPKRAVSSGGRAGGF